MCEISFEELRRLCIQKVRIERQNALSTKFLAVLKELQTEHNSCLGSLTAIAANKSAVLEKDVAERMNEASRQFQLVLQYAMSGDIPRALVEAERTMNTLRLAHCLVFPS